MRPKTRTIAGGLVIAGAVLGTFMSGLFPGFGSGNGIGAQVGETDASSASPETSSNEPPKETVPVEQPASRPVESAPPVILEVRIDNHDYLVPDGNGGFRQTELDEIVRLARTTTGNDDGIRVRIVRTRSARFAAWSALYDSLEEAGLSRDSIRMPKELIE